MPPAMQNVALRTLDLGLLQAGAGVKGEFENRLKSVIEEVKASPTPIILFIDEAHTLIGAGGAAGQGDAANLLKPALARGDLRTIAATTWAEYKKYFERDAALARRFQVVKVEEPDRGRRVRDDARHASRRSRSTTRCGFSIEAVVEAVRLSTRYIPARQLPDKSGQRARHGLRARRHEPDRGAAGDRRPPPADRARDHRNRHPRARERFGCGSCGRPRALEGGQGGSGSCS